MNPKIRRWVLGDFAGARLLRSAIFLFLALLTCGLLVSDRMLFPTPASSYRDLPGLQRLKMPDGTELAALHLTNAEARFTLLHTHGNYEDLGQLLPFLEELREAGFNVFAYDYRGYGASGGRATERTTTADQFAVYRHLVERLDIPPERIIAHGRSVGAALAIALAADNRVGGLVVESGFVSAFRVKTVLPIFPFDKFPNLARIRHVAGPSLVIHGTADDIIPAWHGRKLFAAAPSPKEMVEVGGAGHNDLLLIAGPRYFEALRHFAASLPQICLVGSNRRGEDELKE